MCSVAYVLKYVKHLIEPLVVMAAMSESNSSFFSFSFYENILFINSYQLKCNTHMQTLSLCQAFLQQSPSLLPSLTLCVFLRSQGGKVSPMLFMPGYGVGQTSTRMSSSMLSSVSTPLISNMIMSVWTPTTMSEWSLLASVSQCMNNCWLIYFCSYDRFCRSILHELTLTSSNAIYTPKEFLEE